MFENIKETRYFIVSRQAMRKAKVVVVFVGFPQEADSGGQTIPTLTLFLPSATLFNEIKLSLRYCLACFILNHLFRHSYSNFNLCTILIFHKNITVPQLHRFFI